MIRLLEYLISRCGLESDWRGGASFSAKRALSKGSFVGPTH